MLRRLLAALLLTALLAPALVSAQYVTESTCNNEQIGVQLLLVTSMNDQLETMLTDGTEPQTILAWIQGIQVALNTVITECGGLAFEGTGDAVIGPLTFAGGIYRARMDSESLSQLEVEAVSGDCGRDHLLLNSPSGAGGIEALFQPGPDCVALFEVGARVEWTLSFERIDVPAADSEAAADVEVSATPAPK